MSRSLLIVLAVLALILSVSAQSSSSSSSSSSSIPSLSSSSSSSSVSSSTGFSSSSSSKSSSSSASSSSSSASSSSSSSSSSSWTSSSASVTAANTNATVASTGSSSSSIPAASNTSASNNTWASSSTGSVPVTPVSPYPTGSLAATLVVDGLPSNVTAAEGAPLVQQDIAYNIAAEANATGGSLTVAQVTPYVTITSWNGAPLSGSSRRLLQNNNALAVTFIILGNITNLGSSLGTSAGNTTAVITQFKTAAAAGTLAAPYSGTLGATIPTQTIVAIVPGSGYVSSSTGYGDNGASSVASASSVLLFAAVASLALLL